MSFAKASETSPSISRWRAFSGSFLLQRVSWRQLVASSGLPDDTKNLIRRVITCARLMHFEKIEVTNELISHFQDGHANGRSFSQLIADFGDPGIAGKLIHSSKTRNRPIMMKLIQISGWSTVAVVGVYLTFLAWFHLGRPQPTTDFMVEFNKPIRESDERDKAWPLYRPMWTKYRISEGGQFRSEVFFVDDETVGQRLIVPSDPGWPQAVARLEELTELLEVFRQGTRLPKLGLELQSNAENYSDEDFAALFPHLNKSDYHQAYSGSDDFDDRTRPLVDESILAVLLPHVQAFRGMARIMRIDTRLAMEQQDSERAVENIQAMLGMAGQATDCNVLVGSLVGMAVAHVAFDQLEEILVSDPDFFDADELAELQTRIEGISIHDWMHFEGERVMIHDIIQRVYTDDGHGDGRITSLGMTLLAQFERNFFRGLEDDDFPEYKSLIAIARTVAAPVSVFYVASRKETTDKIDDIIDQYTADTEQPLWQAEFPDYDEFLKENGRRHIVADKLLPAFGAVRNAMDRAIARQEAVIAALAIHRFRLVHGQWPDSIDQLSPAFVAELPVDIITGDFLKLKHDENGLSIYSVGNDRDDDGAAPPVLIFRNGKDETRQTIDNFTPSPRLNPDTDGDWILWPQFNDLKDRRL